MKYLVSTAVLAAVLSLSIHTTWAGYFLGGNGVVGTTDFGSFKTLTDAQIVGEFFYPFIDEYIPASASSIDGGSQSLSVAFNGDFFSEEEAAGAIEDGRVVASWTASTPPNSFNTGGAIFDGTFLLPNSSGFVRGFYYVSAMGMDAESDVFVSSSGDTNIISAGAPSDDASFFRLSYGPGDTLHVLAAPHREPHDLGLYTGLAHARASVSWSVDEFLPGESPTKPIELVSSARVSTAEPSLATLNAITDSTSAQLETPVLGSYGLTGSIFATSTVDSGLMAGLPLDAIDFRTTGPKFSTFEIPSVAELESLAFMLQFDGFSVPFSAGELFSFEDFVVGGVERFQLKAIGSSPFDSSIAGLSYVHGFRFVEEGFAIVSETTIGVPEPSSVALMLGSLLLACGIRRSPDLLKTLGLRQCRGQLAVRLI